MRKPLGPITNPSSPNAAAAKAPTTIRAGASTLARATLTLRSGVRAGVGGPYSTGYVKVSD
jgi:hypothetical protein